MSADTALRGNVRLLGNLLGRVLVEQEGERLLELEERIRSLARAGRQGDAAASAELSETVHALPPGEQATMLRAFALYFQLANIAEQHHRIRRRRASEREGRVQRESLAEALARLGDAGISEEELQAAAARVSVELVLTAHPTEATRRTILASHQRIAGLLRALDDAELTPNAACRGRGCARRGDHDPVADRRGALAAPARRRRDPTGPLVRGAGPLGGCAAPARSVALAAAGQPAPFRDLDRRRPRRQPLGRPRHGRRRRSSGPTRSRSRSIGARCASSPWRGGWPPAWPGPTRRSATCPGSTSSRTPTSPTGGG